jgi:hypothetical protein
MVSLRSISSSSRRSSKSSGDNCGLGNVALARLLMTDGSLAEQAFTHPISRYRRNGVMARAAKIATTDAIALRVPSPSIPRRPPNEVNRFSPAVVNLKQS